MGILNRFKKLFSFDDTGSVSWKTFFNKTETALGQTVVNRKTALSLGAVYRGVDLISSTIGRCDCVTYKAGPNNSRSHAVNHPAYQLLYRSPNDNAPPVKLIEVLIADALLYGNGYAYIQKDDFGNPTAIVNLDPETTKMIIVYSEGNLIPEISYMSTGIGTNGSIQPMPLRADEVIHIRGLGDTWSGLGLLDVAKETVGLAVEVQRFAQMYIDNGGVIQMVVEIPGQFKTDEQKAEFMAQFETRHVGGIRKAFRPAFTPLGTKVTTLQIDADKYALDATADRLDRAVANHLGLAPHKVSVPGIGSSYGSIDAENAATNGDVYDKWFTRTEAELTRKLCSPDELKTGRVFVEFDRSTLLAADTDAHTARSVSLFAANVITKEECRLSLGYPSVAVGTFASDEQKPAEPPAQPTNEVPQKPEDNAQNAAN